MMVNRPEANRLLLMLRYQDGPLKHLMYKGDEHQPAFCNVADKHFVAEHETPNDLVC